MQRTTQRERRAKDRIVQFSRTEVVNAVIHFRDGVKNRRRGSKPKRKPVS